MYDYFESDKMSELYLFEIDGVSKVKTDLKFSEVPKQNHLATLLLLHLFLITTRSIKQNIAILIVSLFL